jgi:hypothetical protein
MVGRRKKPKKDDTQPAAAPRKAGYRDWDTIIPGQPMAPQPYAEQSWQSAPQAYPPAAAPQPQYQQPAPQPQYQQPAPQPQYQQPPPQPQDQQPAQPQPYQQPAPGGPAAPGAPGAPAAPAAGGNPADGTCTKCGAAFGQQAVCDGCGSGRTACLVCGTKIWAGALTCSAHSNAMRR